MEESEGKQLLLNSDRPIWEVQKWEHDHEYGMFICYRDLANFDDLPCRFKRSIKIANQVYHIYKGLDPSEQTTTAAIIKWKEATKAGTPTPPVKQASREYKLLSKKHHWIERAKAYDRDRLVTNQAIEQKEIDVSYTNLIPKILAKQEDIAWRLYYSALREIEFFDELKEVLHYAKKGIKKDAKTEKEILSRQMQFNWIVEKQKDLKGVGREAAQMAATAIKMLREIPGLDVMTLLKAEAIAERNGLQLAPKDEEDEF